MKTFDDAFKTELIVGGSGGATDTFPIITNAVLGTKFKVISGYPGTREVNLAMDRNEVQGNGAITWASIKATMTAMLAEKRINLIVQFGLKPHPDLPHVPYALKYATAAEQRDALMLLFATQEFGRPYIAPPDLPAPIAAALRDSFDGDHEGPGVPGGGETAQPRHRSDAERGDSRAGAPALPDATGDGSAGPRDFRQSREIAATAPRCARAAARPSPRRG